MSISISRAYLESEIIDFTVGYRYSQLILQQRENIYEMSDISKCPLSISALLLS